MRTRLILIAATWAAVVGLGVGSAHAQAPAQSGRQFSLIGVVMLEGGRDLAWIQEPSLTNNKVITVRVGDSVGPYQVTKILTHQVELTGPGGTVAVPLAGSPGAVAVASTSGAAPKQPDLTTPPSSAADVIGRGDPRRLFPVDKLVVGGGGVMTAETLAGQQQQQNLLQAKQAAQAANPSARLEPGVKIPMGDPRQEFPASKMLIGAR